MAHGHEEVEIHVVPADKAKILKIWKTAGILALVTAIEFVFAFTLPSDLKWTKITIFILLTLVKAFYIVAEFMHLGHEKRSLILSIVLPIMFLFWLILALIWEADFILKDILMYW